MSASGSRAASAAGSANASASVSNIDVKGSDDASSSEDEGGLMAPMLMEFFGTFLLVLTVGQGGNGGVALACLVWMGGHVSGGHFNPAVTVGVLLRGVMPGYGCSPVAAGVIYIVMQYVGAVLAAALSIWGAVAGDALALTDEFVAFSVINEFFFTFFLVLVVLHVATASTNSPNQFFGAAIGGVVFAGVGTLNPAVAVARIMHPDTDATRCLIPMLVPYLGGAFAALIFWITSPKDF